jgi:DNA-binding NarL/FixJ family response regulator
MSEVTATALRVLIADDHLPLRAGVRDVLERGGCEVCAEAGNADEAIAGALAERPDVCLIDLRMPGDGMRAIEEIARRLPLTRVVVLTVSNDSDDLLHALRAGAVGYLLKDMNPGELPDALRAVFAGEAAIPGTLTAKLVEELQRREPRRLLTTPEGRHVTLTPREWEVGELLVEGLSTAEIAAMLALDQVTVRRYMSDIRRKLNVSTRADAAELLARLRSRRPTSGA